MLAEDTNKIFVLILFGNHCICVILTYFIFKKPSDKAKVIMY